MAAFLFVPFSYGSDKCADAMKVEALEGYVAHFEGKANRYSSEAEKAEGLGMKRYWQAEAENAINMSIMYKGRLEQAKKIKLSQLKN